ncbi:MAG: Rieske (2Fe-2S) protein [Chloroflexota bacterium]
MTKQKIAVAQMGEVPSGERKIVEVNGKSIGLFNVNGQYVAVLNLCPHELAPVCLGRVSGTTLPSPPEEYHWGRDGEILACPWHGWEFDLLTGECLTDRKKLLTYPVEVEGETISIVMARRP